MDDLVRCGQRCCLPGGHAVVLAGQGGSGLAEHFHAVHQRVVHQAVREPQGLPGGRRQHEPGAGGAAGQRAGHAQAHGAGRRCQIEGSAGGRCRSVPGFRILQGGWFGQKLHFLHQREKMAGKARIAADARDSSLPRFTDGFFFRRVKAGLAAAHAGQNVGAAQQQAQDVAVDFADGFAQGAAGALLPFAGRAAPAWAVGLIGHVIVLWRGLPLLCEKRHKAAHGGGAHGQRRGVV